MSTRRWVIVVALCVCGLTACKSKEAVTAREVGCNTRDVQIIESEFSRAGSLTRWCARCGSDFYLCVSNPQRDPVECRKVAPVPPCE